jgi:hypothetical protein
VDFLVRNGLGRLIKMVNQEQRRKGEPQMAVGCGDLSPASGRVYNVHMKRITASQARKDWFRILDEVAAGEIVVIERNGHRISMQREAKRVSETPVPSYARLLKVNDPDLDEGWSWEWKGPGKDLAFKARRKK